MYGRQGMQIRSKGNWMTFHTDNESENTDTNLIEQISEMLENIVAGQPPRQLDIPTGIEDPALLRLATAVNRLAADFKDTTAGAIALSNGVITGTIGGKNLISGSLKNLQASLRHLTWQTKQVANGDFHQRVDFLGDFSDSFNWMVEKLDNTINELIEKERELSARNADLDSFAYTVSHDLKSPLITISGYVEVLLEDYSSVLAPDAVEYLNRIGRTCQKLMEMVTAVLSYARTGRDGIRLEELSFSDIATEAADYLSGPASVRGVTVTIDDAGATIIADRNLMRQLMLNLINNAIKFIGKDNPAPEVRIGSLREKSTHQFIYFISDNGIGIPPQSHNNIFRVFGRLPGTDDIEGTGIGLATVKRIIDIHKGRIWLDSAPGKGTTFYFTVSASSKEKR